MKLRNLFLLVLAFGVGPAFGSDVSIVDLNDPILKAGATVDFTGIIQNDTTSYVMLNAIGVQGLPSGLTVDTSPFTLGPYLVTPNATSIDFTFFTITAPANYTGPFGLLPATIMILGDTSFEEITTTATNPLGDRNFNLSVQAASVSAPEPATWLSFVLGLLLMACSRLAGRRVRYLEVHKSE